MSEYWAAVYERLQDDYDFLSCFAMIQVILNC